jgi:hypothetical protein
MNVRDIEMRRDGGTISFTLDTGASVSSYRLRTPFAGDQRLLSCDESELVPGGDDEAVVLAGLRAWYAAQLGPQLVAALDRLDALPEWRNLPPDLVAAVPLHRIRTVIRCLEARAA